MATYGKKKRTLLSGFSVFRDDPTEVSRSSAPTKLGRAKSAAQKQKSMGLHIPEDDSADELAGDPLLDHAAHQPLRSSLQSDSPVSGRSKSGSHRIGDEDRNKPLPPIPTSDILGNLRPLQKSKTVLTSKSTNLKIPRKPENVITKSSISHPVLQDTEDNYHNLALRAINGINKWSTDGLQTSVDDAEHLSRKISSLMQQAAIREAARVPKPRDASEAAVARYSPLERSKAAVVKATQVIASRLSNGGRHSSSFKAKKSDSGRNSLVGFEYQSGPGSPGTFYPGNSMRNGKVMQEPLPVYESMRSVSHSPDPLQDPFSDGNRTNDQLSPEIQADLDFDFNKRKGKGKRLNVEQQHIEGRWTKDATTPSMDVPPTPMFSNNISGLTQHPNAMIFSTPPIGFSTPTDRLVPPTGQLQESSLLGNTAYTPSILEFSFEESDDDNTPDTKDSEAVDGSMSVKRKSAKEDLRAQLSPLSGRARKRPSNSEHQVDFATKMKEMDTEDARSYVEKDKNLRSGRPATSDSMRRGLGIFESPLGPDPIDSVEGKSKRQWGRTHAAKRLSIPTPNSILFSRESRAHYRLRDTSDGDTLDVDELQTGDGSYRVRALKSLNI